MCDGSNNEPLHSTIYLLMFDCLKRESILFLSRKQMRFKGSWLPSILFWASSFLSDEDTTTVLFTIGRYVLTYAVFLIDLLNPVPVFYLH